ncbi:MAG: hypothetical protein VX112_04600 [Pseudomonadota bacterium]|nr:hypothetical protein [Pseudomonadota bacterium]
MTAILTLLKKLSSLIYIHSLAKNQQRYQTYQFNAINNDFQFQSMSITMLCLFIGTSIRTWLLLSQIPAFLLFYHGVFLARTHYKHLKKARPIPSPIDSPSNLGNKIGEKETHRNSGFDRLRTASWVYNNLAPISLPASLQTPIVYLLHRWIFPEYKFAFQKPFDLEYEHNTERDDLENFATYVFKLAALLLAVGYVITQTSWMMLYYSTSLQKILLLSLASSALIWCIRLATNKPIRNLSPTVFHEAPRDKIHDIHHNKIHLLQFLLRLPVTLTLRAWVLCMNILSITANSLHFYRISPWLSKNLSMLIALVSSCAILNNYYQTYGFTWQLVNPTVFTTSILILYSLKLLSPFLQKICDKIAYLNGLFIPWSIRNIRIATLGFYQYYIAKPLSKHQKLVELGHIPQKQFNVEEAIMNPMGVIELTPRENLDESFSHSVNQWYYLTVLSLQSYIVLVYQTLSHFSEKVIDVFGYFIKSQTVITAHNVVHHTSATIKNLFKTIPQSGLIVIDCAVYVFWSLLGFSGNKYYDNIISRCISVGTYGKNIVSHSYLAISNIFYCGKNILSTGIAICVHLFRYSLYACYACMRTSVAIANIPFYAAYISAHKIRQSCHKSSSSDKKNRDKAIILTTNNEPKPKK